CTFAVARYSSKLLLAVLVKTSEVIIPKFPRNTHFGRKFHAIPRRGWKLFRSFLASEPGLCRIAPVRPVSGSRAVGSNCEMRPLPVLKGVSNIQRSPRFSVKFRLGFQSSWRYNEWLNHRGDH